MRRPRPPAGGPTRGAPPPARPGPLAARGAAGRSRPGRGRGARASAAAWGEEEALRAPLNGECSRPGRKAGGGGECGRPRGEAGGRGAAGPGDSPSRPAPLPAARRPPPGFDPPPEFPPDVRGGWGVEDTPPPGPVRPRPGQVCAAPASGPTRAVKTGLGRREEEVGKALRAA